MKVLLGLPYVTVRPALDQYEPLPKAIPMKSGSSLLYRLLESDVCVGRMIIEFSDGSSLNLT